MPRHTLCTCMGRNMWRACAYARASKQPCWQCHGMRCASCVQPVMRPATPPLHSAVVVQAHARDSCMRPAGAVKHIKGCSSCSLQS